MYRVCFIAASVVTLAALTATAEEKKPPLPPLDSKEWKKVGTDGLAIWDVKEGEGTAVPAEAKVTVKYIGWLTNGDVFDSSKEPITFALGKVIKGWQQGIPGMKPGGIRRLKIPPALAYGARKVGDIPPNSTLVFEVELIEQK